MIRFMEACPAVQNQVIRGHPDRHQNHSGFRPESALGSAGLWASHHCKVDPGMPSRAWASRSGNPAILASRSGSIRRLGRPSLTPSARPCQTCLDLFLGSGPLQSAKTARMSSCSFPAGIVQSIRSPIQAAALLNALPSLPRTMVGLAILSGLRRGELFALRWKDIDEHARLLTVREAVYDGTFSTPKTRAGSRQIPLSDTAQRLVVEWKALARATEPEALVFSTRQGKLISPNNVLRRSVFPACEQLGLPHATWLTFRRTYSSWSHDKGVRGKVVAQLMGHSNVDTTLNVYTQVLDGSVRDAVEKIGSELITIVHFSEKADPVSH